MASEIAGLGALRGYLKLGNLVVRLSVPFLHRPRTQPAFVARPRPRGPAAVPVAPPDAPTSGPVVDGDRARDLAIAHGREFDWQ
jgi:hypothetical protein